MKNVSSKISILGLILLGIGLSACASTKDPKIDDWGQNSGVPLGHGENTVLIPPPPPPIVNAPPLAPPQMSYGTQYDGQATYLAGCTGEYFVADFNSGKILASGRAYNANDGLYILNTKGQKTGQIVNPSAGRSVFFRPDCGCKTGAVVPAQPMMHNHAACPNN